MLIKAVESMELGEGAATPTPPPPVVKIGKEGKPLPITANIIRFVSCSYSKESGLYPTP